MRVISAQHAFPRANPQKRKGELEIDMKTWIILRDVDYDTERWYDICEIANVPHDTRKIKIHFDAFKDVEVVPWDND